MESTSIAMKIHISQTTRKFLPSAFKVSERGDIEVKGKGSMKSYWLEYRENRLPLPQLGTDTDAEIKAIEFNQDRRMSMPQYIQAKPEAANAEPEDRRVYSPVTFEEVAKRSIINSPIRNILSGRSRVSRSNSMGHAFMQSPSDVFGGLFELI